MNCRSTEKLACPKTGNEAKKMNASAARPAGMRSRAVLLKAPHPAVHHVATETGIVSMSPTPTVEQRDKTVRFGPSRPRLSMRHARPGGAGRVSGPSPRPGLHRPPACRAFWTVPGRRCDLHVFRDGDRHLHLIVASGEAVETPIVQTVGIPARSIVIAGQFVLLVDQNQRHPHAVLDRIVGLHSQREGDA